jgi:hypothetical protein
LYRRRLDRRDRRLAVGGRVGAALEERRDHAAEQQGEQQDPDHAARDRREGATSSRRGWRGIGFSRHRRHRLGV